MAASYVTTMLRSLEVLFPRECLVCHRPLRGSYLCFRCRPTVPCLDDIMASRCSACFSPHIHPAGDDAPCPTCILFPLMPDRIRFLWEYGGLPRDLIRAMKYRPSPTLTRLAGSWMAESLVHLFDEQTWDLIIPIPSSPIAYRKRLFHPCAELARLVACTTPTPVYTELLRHTSARSPQALRTHEERLRGLKGLFSCTRPTSVQGKSILVVEDVITTGATLGAAAYTLRSAGAVRVDVFALARTPVWARFRSRIHAIFETSQTTGQPSLFHT
jgi:predicted amidophosphoribosyltransferase